MKKDYLNSYGVEAITQAFFYLGKYESLILPTDNERLIRDIKVQLDTFGIKHTIQCFNEHNTSIRLIQ